MADVMLSLPEAQVVELTRQLSPQGKRAVLRALIPELDQFEILLDYGSEQIHTLCKQRGIDWGSLSEEEREQFIDDLLHEE